ncbi:MAG: GNAT family N-acetyltransferase [Lachnospiraceae bacterium]|nr:GNAT family N-acetyltransferase [Lachnospiraceae bacterium]
MNIEPASINDINDIKRLYKILYLDMSKLQPEYCRAADEDEDFIKMIIESDKDDILIVKENHQVLGFALVQQQDTPPFNCIVPHKYAYLMDIVITPEQRGKGIGRQLINAVKSWAKSRKMEYIELGVLTQNENAVKLYESMEFFECRKTMRMKI